MACDHRKIYNYRTILTNSDKLLRSLLEDDEDLLLITSSPQNYNANNIIWVTPTNGDIKGDNVTIIDVRDLAHLMQFVVDYLNKKSITIIIDSIERLVIFNSEEAVLRFLLMLKDYVHRYMSRLVVFIDPSTVSKRFINVLKREFGILCFEKNEVNTSRKKRKIISLPSWR